MSFDTIAETVFSFYNLTGKHSLRQVTQKMCQAVFALSLRLRCVGEHIKTVRVFMCVSFSLSQCVLEMRWDGKRERDTINPYNPPSLSSRLCERERSSVRRVKALAGASAILYLLYVPTMSLCAYTLFVSFPSVDSTWGNEKRERDLDYGITQDIQNCTFLLLCLSFPLLLRETESSMWVFHITRILILCLFHPLSLHRLKERLSTLCTLYPDSAFRSKRPNCNFLSKTKSSSDFFMPIIPPGLRDIY